jgi:hypothetical protein
MNESSDKFEVSKRIVRDDNSLHPSDWHTERSILAHEENKQDDSVISFSPPKKLFQASSNASTPLKSSSGEDTLEEKQAILPQDQIIEEHLSLESFANSFNPISSETPSTPPIKQISLPSKKISIICLLLTLIPILILIGFKLKRVPDPIITSFLDSIKDPSIPVFLRQWTPGTREVYHAGTHLTVITGNSSQQSEQPISQDSKFVVTTLEVNKTSIFVHLLLLNVFTTDTEETIEKRINDYSMLNSEQDEMPMIWCWISPTGLVQECSKPKSLNRTSFDMMMSYLEQYSPRLEKKYYNTDSNNRRLLQQTNNSLENLLEAKEYNYDLNEEEGSVQLTNNFEDENFSSQPGNSDIITEASCNAMTSAKMDGGTGQVKSVSQLGSFNLKPDPNLQNVLFPVFTFHSTNFLDLESTDNSIPSKTISKLIDLQEVTKTINLLNPITNRTAIEEVLNNSNPIYNDDITNSTNSTGRRLAGVGKIVFSLYQTLIEHNIMGSFGISMIESIDFLY